MVYDEFGCKCGAKGLDCHLIRIEGEYPPHMFDPFQDEFGCKYGARSS